MALDEVLSRCITKWRAESSPLLPPVTEPEVRRVWNSRGWRLSDDVLCLYTTVGGFADWVYLADFYWCLWPWNGLQQRNAEGPSQGIKFCDHSIDIVVWELRYEDERHSSVWRSYRPEVP